MSNRNKVMQRRWVPPVFAAGLVAVMLTTSAGVAPHVANEGFYNAFWLGAVSVVALLGAIVATIATIIFAGISIGEWLDE